LDITNRPDRIVYQRGLPDTGLAEHNECCAFAPARLKEKLAEQIALVAPTPQQRSHRPSTTPIRRSSNLQGD
jgi:hypothetical protein